MWLEKNKGSLTTIKIKITPNRRQNEFSKKISLWSLSVTKNKIKTITPPEKIKLILSPSHLSHKA